MKRRTGARNAIRFVTDTDMAGTVLESMSSSSLLLLPVQNSSMPPRPSHSLARSTISSHKLLAAIQTVLPDLRRSQHPSLKLLLLS